MVNATETGQMSHFLPPKTYGLRIPISFEATCHWPNDDKTR
jgi:hypothetical protein